MIQTLFLLGNVAQGVLGAADILGFDPSQRWEEAQERARNRAQRSVAEAEKRAYVECCAQYTELTQNALWLVKHQDWLRSLSRLDATVDEIDSIPWSEEPADELEARVRECLGASG